MALTKYKEKRNFNQCPEPTGSWVAPKGPPTDPDIKRSAIMTEDHPYDYRNFEGIIPSSYVTGTDIVWDEGYYELADANDMNKKVQDAALHTYQGSLKRQ